jgi:hypothetical protein
MLQSPKSDNCMHTNIECWCHRWIHGKSTRGSAAGIDVGCVSKGGGLRCEWACRQFLGKTIALLTRED